MLFSGVSCEKHQWEDSIVVKEEKIYDSDMNLVGVQENREVEVKGTKRFFVETHGSKHPTVDGQDTKESNKQAPVPGRD